MLLDPARLAHRQIEIDRARTADFPHLLDHKADRMTASPLALLRGAAPLFYELLAHHPTLAEGPPGKGWLVGDAHIENFGAYRAGELSAADAHDAPTNETVVFDLNDFDDAFVGPWRFDVLRLATSLVLGGREAGADGKTTIALCAALIDAYVEAAFRSKKKAPAPPAPVARLIEKVQSRTRVELLAARTEVAGDARRFVRGPRYEDLPARTREKAERAFAKYAKELAKSSRAPKESFEVIDAAFRVAGTGSLGCLRIALLVRGKGGRDGAWVFDMKAQGDPSATALVRPPRLAPAERVCTALGACLARPPRMIGAGKLRGQSMFVRRLAPQEDKLDLTKVGAHDLEPLARHLGALLGGAHKRGATRAPKGPWSAEDRRALLDRAVTLAGIHEAMYLAYCGIVRK